MSVESSGPDTAARLACSAMTARWVSSTHPRRSGWNSASVPAPLAASSSCAGVAWAASARLRRAGWRRGAAAAAVAGLRQAEDSSLAPAVQARWLGITMPALIVIADER